MAFRSVSTRGSDSTVQTKIFAQLAGSDAGLRIGETLFGNEDMLSIFLIMLKDKIAHIIRQGHTSGLRIGRELRLYLLRHIKRYGHAESVAESGGPNNLRLAGRVK